MTPVPDADAGVPRVARRSVVPVPDALLVFAAALIFYTITLAPTVVWGDSASISWRAFVGAFRIGTAEDHPVFMLVGWLFARLPGEVARNVNLASAMFGALAVMLVYRCSRLLGACRAASLAGAVALCVSHAFWLHAVIAEVYTANAFFLAASIALLLEWRRARHWGWLAGAAGTFVVGLANHLVLVTAAPAAVVFVIMIKGRALFTRAFFAASGLALAALAVLAIAPPPSVAEAFQRLWNGPAPISEYLTLTFAPAATAKEAGYYFLFLAYQFPSVSFFLGFFGAWRLWRDDRAAAVLLLLTIAVNAGLFIRHTVWPSTSGTKYVFYIADYVIFAMLCAVGTHAVLTRLARMWTASRLRVAAAVVVGLVAVVPPLVYAAVPVLTKMAGVNLFSARPIAYRDNVRFFLNPNKRGEDGARRFGDEAFAVAKPKAVIFADHTPYAVLRYMQITEGIRPDVLVPRLGGDEARVRWMSEGGERRPTYLADAPRPGYYDLSRLKGQFDVIPVGPIFEVRPRE